MDEKVFEQIMDIRAGGRVKMLSVNEVQRLAFDSGYYELVNFITDHRAAYFHFIMTGEMPEVYSRNRLISPPKYVNMDTLKNTQTKEASKMENAFAEDLAREQALRKAYAEASTEEAKQEVREAHRAFEAALEEKGGNYARYFWEYDEAQQRGNACIDFRECIWNKDIPQMVEDLKAFGIREFTISSTYSSIVETAWVFQQNGCILEGLEEINGHFTDFKTGEYKKVPAFKFRIS